MKASDELKAWLRAASNKLAAYQARELAEIIKHVEREEHESDTMWHQLNPEGMGR